MTNNLFRYIVLLTAFFTAFFVDIFVFAQAPDLPAYNLPNTQPNPIIDYSHAKDPTTGCRTGDAKCINTTSKKKITNHNRKDNPNGDKTNVETAKDYEVPDNRAQAR